MPWRSQDAEVRATWVSAVALLPRGGMLTLEGREALREHWERLERIRKGAKALKDAEDYRLSWSKRYRTLA